MRERLSISLTATLGGTEHSIPGGDVRALSLTMTSYGVEGSISFVVQDDSSYGGKYTDEVLDDFVKSDLASVSITVQAQHWDSTTETSLPEIQTNGLVLDKSVTEKVIVRGFPSPPVLYRVYTLRFCDPAQALWREHFPCDLYVKKTFQDVIDAYKGDKITLSYDWDELTSTRPLIFFHLDPARGASFYDLVLWFVRYFNGVWTFDHASGSYSIKSEKDTSGETADLLASDVLAMTSVFPHVFRYKPRVLNSYTESPTTTVIDNTDAATGMYRDSLLRTSIAQDVDDRVTLETARRLSPGREIELSFKSYPTVSVTPGSLVNIVTGGGFSGDLIPSSEAFRVYELRLEARALDTGPEANYGDTATDFELELGARLEAKSETKERLPEIKEPHYPGFLEGKVVSETGGDTDLTYQIYQDEDTSLEQYDIKIPLFSDQVVTAPFEPHYGSGTFYLPAYKDARVLVRLYFDKAVIARMLDWRTSAVVAQDTQGQHLFLGKSDTSNTSILHDYEDDKPVLQIKRTNSSDTAFVRIEEGKLTIKVEETQS